VLLVLWVHSLRRRFGPIHFGDHPGRSAVSGHGLGESRKPILHLKLWIRVSDPDRRDGNAAFSHGVCPECAKKHYPQIEFCKMKEE